MFTETDKNVVIMGAGPAGLTAAYELTKAGVHSVVLEQDSMVGGISRTVSYKGYLFDIGGHRFFTKVQAVDDMWREVLAHGDFLRRRRLSRIFYNKKFFDYPLRATNALAGLGLFNSILILFSYFKAQMYPIKPERTFEQWITNRFGKRLYLTFFKTYTEKVWGIPCHEITAEWAAQRIKGLSLITALKNAIIQRQCSDKSKVIKTLIDAFDYPRKGPGMMWEATRNLIETRGSEIAMESKVERIFWNESGVTEVQIKCGDTSRKIKGTHFLSTLPIRELIRKLDPAPPAAILQAAEKLNYRDFITVAVVVNQKELFPDNWIYVHDPDVKVGRIQNFKNWSPEMVADENKTCLGLEYFCFEGDNLWTMSDSDLLELAKNELHQLKLVQAGDVEDGTVVRVPKAYPVYDSTYQDAIAEIRCFLGRLPNLQLIGRNGMHKYNNQDHSMLTAMLAVKNILGASHNLWEVNADKEYHEEVKNSESEEQKQLAAVLSTQPPTPRMIK